MTGQYMESRKEDNIDLIVIYNTTNYRDIVAVNESLLPETIMSMIGCIPIWEKLTNRYHNNLLKGINSRYIYCGQNNYLNKSGFINMSSIEWCLYWDILIYRYTTQRSEIIREQCTECTAQMCTSKESKTYVWKCYSY